MEAKVGIPDVLFRDVVVRGFWVTPYFINMSKADKHQFAQEVMGLLARKVVVPTFGKTYPLREVVQAIEHATRPARGAKIGLSTN